MAKVILLNGSPHPEGCTATALAEMIKVFEKEGIETEVIQVGGKNIRGCMSCNSCRKLGRCVINDLVNEVREKLLAADGMVIGSPVYYGSPNGEHIGLYNVAARLRLSGRSEGLVIRSDVESGTSATMRLPRMLAEKEAENE